MTTSPVDTLRGLITAIGIGQAAGAGAAADADSTLERVTLTGTEPVLPSSFAVGTAAQTSIAAAALAADAIRQARGHRAQRISVDMRRAALECAGYFTVDGQVPVLMDPISGLYPCGDGWVRIHANFAHHRDGALVLLGLPADGSASRQDVERRLRDWAAEDFEQAAAQAGLVVAAQRSFARWDLHPQATAVADTPLVTIERIGDAPPRGWRAADAKSRPLAGLRVLECTRILAGPVAGRTLAAYGAEVMLVNSPTLPNVASIIETSRGKCSAHIDLKTADGQAQMATLLAGADLFVQGYRPGSLADLGLGAQALAERHPGIVCASLSAYGHTGPWADRRGFDSLVQTGTGFNHAEAVAAAAPKPRAMPVQILDYASGFLIAAGAQAAIARQRREGGSWHVRVSLARTAHWLRGLGRVENGFDAPRAEFRRELKRYDTGWGEMRAVPHAARFARTPARWVRPSMPPGTHPPTWPERA
ncbi:MAG: CoA transferase [Burkholderiaceae bacterium]